MDINPGGKARICLASQLSRPAHVLIGTPYDGSEVTLTVSPTRLTADGSLRLASSTGDEVEVAADQPLLTVGPGQ